MWVNNNVGIQVKCGSQTQEPDVKFYIPHLCVLRAESNSTPLKVLYNASSLTSTEK